jgi:hypothetical protein
VKFKNQLEIYEYLQAAPGNMVKRTIDDFPDVVILINGNACWYPDGKEPVHFANPNAWEPYEQPKWYLDLKHKRPSGVLCRVWQDDEDPNAEIDTDGEYSTVNYTLINDTIVYENVPQFLDVSQTCWDHAVPVTDTHEIYQYLIKYK